VRGLPSNWISTELSKAVIYSKGKKPKTLSITKSEDLVPYIDIKAFEKGIIDEYADIQSSKLIDGNDILVVWDGARFGLTGMGIIGAAGSTLMVLKPVLCYPKYIYSFINRYYSYINSKPKGTGTPHVNPDVFWNLSFPIAPLNEQKRIVAKLDAIMPRIDAVKERLDKVPGILKRFRQSVLTAAVTGKLTGSEGYKTSSFGELIVSIRGGTTTPPRKEFSNYPVLRSSSVRQGFIDYNDVFYLTEEQSTRQANFIQNGDVLFTRLNGSAEFVGNCAVVKGIKNNFIQYPDRLYCAKLKRDILPEYCEIAFADPFLRLEIENRAKSSAGHKRISISDVEEMIILLPPLEEQQEIVRQVDKLFALADKVEAHYQKAKARVDKLSQSVLAKAFRGELVPQDPNDEPAEKLLERILEEKTKMEAELKGGRKKVARKAVNKNRNPPAKPVRLKKAMPCSAR